MWKFSKKCAILLSDTYFSPQETERIDTMMMCTRCQKNVAVVFITKLENGKTINSVPLEKFVGECRVIEVDTDMITGDYVDKHFPRGTKRILIKSV